MEPLFEKFYLESLLKIFVPQFIYKYFDRRQGVLSLLCVSKLCIFCMHILPDIYICISCFLWSNSLFRNSSITMLMRARASSSQPRSETRARTVGQGPCVARARVRSTERESVLLRAPHRSQIPPCPLQSPLILVLPPPAPSPLPPDAQSLRELMHRHGLNPRPGGASTRMHVYALTGSHCVPLATTWFSRADRVLAHAGETGGTTWRCIAYTSCCPPHGPYGWFARSQPYGCFARSQRGPSLHSPRPCQRLPLGHFELYLVSVVVFS